MNTEKKRRRYTTQEKAELVSEYQNSGLPQKVWCGEHHISVNTLHKWMQTGTTKSETCEQSWIPITVRPNTQEAADENIALKIGKCRFDISATTDKQLLAEVIEIVVRLC